MDTKEIVITLEPIRLNVSEDMSAEDIQAMLDRLYPSGTLNPAWSGWKYGPHDEWRN